MKNKVSELKRIDNKIYKIVLFILAIMLDLCFGIIVISFISDRKHFDIQNLIYTIIYAIIFIFLTIFLFRKLVNKKGRRSYSVMKRFCSYKELAQLTKNEDFKQVIYKGVDKVFESKLWLIIGDTFVPKNYITSAYLRKGARDIYCIHIILIDGSYIYYTASIEGNDLEQIKRTLRRCVKQIVIFDDRNLISQKISKELKSRYEKYKGSSNFTRFIDKWNDEFDVKSLINQMN